VTAQQIAARATDNSRDAKNFAAAESPSAVTAQQPAGISALAEAPAVNDIAADKPSGSTPLSSPRKVSKVQQPANVAALAEARERSNRKVQVAPNRTAHDDPNSRERENGRPFDFFSLIGRTILGANSSFNDQIR
jgi:hypothetical protein